ncbi:MAG: LSU ribosomal protein L14p (L23e), partial [uncultured Gemmatimonadaceae bacterium]
GSGCRRRRRSRCPRAQGQGLHEDNLAGPGGSL